jgi:hypothetical protein
MVAWSGNPDALLYALEHTEPHSWDLIMKDAILSGSLECVRVLYGKGYVYGLRHSGSPTEHPAVHAAWVRPKEILCFVVDRSGPPQAEFLSAASVEECGVEMLEYVWKLGRVLNEYTTGRAA